MGDFAERLRKYKQKELELKQRKEPDPASQGKEYVEYKKAMRREPDMVNYFRNDLAAQEFPTDKVLKAYSDTVGADKFEQYKDSLWNNTAFTFKLDDYIRTKRPELYENLPPEKKTEQVYYKFANNGKLKKQAEVWLKNGSISRAEVDEIMGKAVIAIYDKLPGVTDTEVFLDNLEAQLSPEEKEKFTNTLDAHKDDLDEHMADPVTYPLKDRCDQLKQAIPENIADDAVKKEDYEKALDYAAQHVTKTKTEVTTELGAVDVDSNHVNVAREKRAMFERRSSFDNGRFDRLYTKNPATGGIKVLNRGREKDLQAVLDEGVTLSEKTRKGLELMLRKMEEMELEKYGYSELMEQGTKVYGLNKMLWAQNALVEAVNKNPPDPEEIIKAKQEHEKVSADYRELFNIAREYFNQDPYVHPGNLDSWRHADFPYEFTGQCHTMAQINGVFLAYQNWKVNGVDLDAYLKRPTTATMDNYAKRFEPYSFGNRSKDARTVEDTVELLSSRGKFAGAADEYDRRVHPDELQRPLKLPAMLEGDPALAERNEMLADITIFDIGSTLKESEGSKFNYFRSLEGELSPEAYNAKLQTLQNIMLVSDDQRDAGRIIHGLPATDVYGRVVAEPFNAEEFLKRTPVDYAGIMDRADRVYKKIASMENDGLCIIPDDVLAATQQLYLRVLAAHPEDKEKPEYQAMRAAIGEMKNSLSKEAPDDVKDMMQRTEKSVGKQLKQADKRYRTEQRQKQKREALNGRLTLEQFMDTYPNLGLNEDNYRYLYEHINNEDMKKAVLAFEKGINIDNDIFKNWDRPLTRTALNQSTLPPGVRVGGDPKELKAYLESNNGKNLNAADMAFVLKHIEVAERTKQIGEEASQSLRNGEARADRPSLTRDAEGFLQLNVRQPAAQNSANGCWSVALQQIVQGRGVEDVSQEDIRSYRPADRGVYEVQNNYAGDIGLRDADLIYNKDQANTVKDMLDPVLAFAPNTMVRVVEIGAYDTQANKALTTQNISEKQYRENAKELIRQTVEKALVFDHSPLVIRQPGHFVNIVGIRDDILLVQDPLSSVNPPSRMRKVPIDSFVEAMLFQKGTQGDVTRNIQLLWGSDIRLDREGKIIGLPDQEVTMADDGEVKLNNRQAGENGFLLETQKNGFWVNKYGNRDGEPRNDEQMISADGLIRSDRVYMPRKLDAVALKAEAQKLTPEEERRLKENAEAYYLDAKDLKGRSMTEIGRKGLDVVKQDVAEETRFHQQKNALPENLDDKQKTDKAEHQHRYDSAAVYVGTLLEFKKNARELLEDLRRTGVDAQADPQEYRMLVRQLEDACALSIKNSPKQINDSINLLVANTSICNGKSKDHDNDERQRELGGHLSKAATEFNQFALDKISSYHGVEAYYGGNSEMSLEQMLKDPAGKLGMLRTKDEEKSVSESAEQFAGSVEQLAERAKEHLSTLDGLTKTFTSDSVQYTNMKNALRKVSEMGRGNTPLEVYEAVSELNTLSKAYTDKIDKEHDGKHSTGSKRYAAANEISIDMETSGLTDITELKEGIFIDTPIRQQAEQAFTEKMNAKGLDFEMVDGTAVRKGYREEIERMKKAEEEIKAAKLKEEKEAAKQEDTKDTKRRKLDKSEVKDFLSSGKKEKKEHKKTEDTKGRTDKQIKDKDIKTDTVRHNK